MFCTECGAKGQAVAKFCGKCGHWLAPTGEESAAAVLPPSIENIAIWNPTAVCNWSLLFSPAFGSFLHAVNWRALGESEKARSAMGWFYISLAMLGLFPLLALAYELSGLGEDRTGILPLAFLGFWYFAAGRGQAKYVEGRLGSSYQRRSWPKPLLIAAAALVAYFVFIAAGFASLNLIAVLPRTDEDYTSVVQEELRAVAKNVENFYHDHGLEIGPASAIQMIELRDGEVREFAEHFDRGGSVAIIGGCDQDCSDLDLIVFDPEGDQIARDREADDRPLIWFDPQLTGEYRIVATMHSCATEWCMSGYTALRSASPTPMAGEGTGFVVDATGGILTADHLIDDAASITVVFADGSRAEAAVERRSPANDVALLRVNAATPAYLPLARPRSTRVGDEVFVVGFPLIDQLGDEPKFTEGSVTALSGSSGESAQIQMSVPIQPGSSGSPVVNQYGHVVGIATSSAPDEALLEETGAIPQLVNWATKAEIALALVGRQHDARADRLWSASSRDEALAYARNATVRILVQGDGAEP